MLAAVLNVHALLDILSSGGVCLSPSMTIGERACVLVSPIGDLSGVKFLIATRPGSDLTSFSQSKQNGKIRFPNGQNTN